MARVYRKPLSQVLADTKRLRAKQALSREMAYCKKCGWGWELSPQRERVCPHCGEKYVE